MSRKKLRIHLSSLYQQSIIKARILFLLSVQINNKTKLKHNEITVLYRERRSLVIFSWIQTPHHVHHRKK